MPSEIILKHVCFNLDNHDTWVIQTVEDKAHNRFETSWYNIEEYVSDLGGVEDARYSENLADALENHRTLIEEHFSGTEYFFIPPEEHAAWLAFCDAVQLHHLAELN